MAKFADLLRHSQTLLADRAVESGGSHRPPNMHDAASDGGGEINHGGESAQRGHFTVDIAFALFNGADLYTNRSKSKLKPARKMGSNTE